MRLEMSMRFLTSTLRIVVARPLFTPSSTLHFSLRNMTAAAPATEGSVPKQILDTVTGELVSKS